MGDTYTPTANIAINILNRRKKTEVIDRLKSATPFDKLIKSDDEFGDTVETIDIALSEKKNFCPKLVQAGKYVQQYANKWYNTINWGKTYYNSKTQIELRKAMKDTSSMANLVSAIEAKNLKSWKVDFYYQCVKLMEDDTLIPYINVPNLNFTTEDKATREDAIEKFIQIVLETKHDMSFISNRYIAVDTGLTAEVQGRFVGMADDSELTLYINKKYDTWVTVELTKRFNTKGIDLQMEVIDFKDANVPARLAHKDRYTYRPTLDESDAQKVFGTTRIDIAKMTQGTFANIPLFPAVMFTIDGVSTGNPQPSDKGTRYETVAETADSVASC